MTLLCVLYYFFFLRWYQVHVFSTSVVSEFKILAQCQPESRRDSHLHLCGISCSRSQPRRGVSLQQLHNQQKCQKNTRRRNTDKHKRQKHRTGCTRFRRSLASCVRQGGRLSLHFRILSMVFFRFSPVNGGYREEGVTQNIPNYDSYFMRLD